MKSITVFILFLLLFNIQIFFAVNYFFVGYNVNYVEGGSSFKMMILISFVYCIALSLIQVFLRKGTPNSLILILILIIFVLFLHTLHFFAGNISRYFSKDLLYFLFLGIPGSLIYLILNNLNASINTINESLHILFSIFIMIGDFFFIEYQQNISLERLLFTFGNLHSQGTSYLFALISGFYLIRLKEKFRIAYIIFVLNSFILTLSAGGKGAIVLIFIYILLNVNIRISLSLFILLIILYILGSNSILFESTQEGFQRIAVLFNGESDISTISSDRDYVYLNIVSVIKSYLFFGIGPLSPSELGFQPHNLFLDLILRFGLFFGFIFIICILFFCARALVKYSKLPFLLRLILPFVIINNLFSGSIMDNPFFYLSVFLYLDFYKKYHISKVINSIY
jgi:hypothetical protein